MHATLRILGWIIAAVLWTLLAWLIAMLSLILLYPLFWLLIPVVLMFIYGYRRQLARRRASAVLTYLDQAARLNLPLTDVMAAAAAGERGRLSQTLRAVAASLRRGMTVGDALARSANEVPRRLQQTVAVGERIGRLPQALARATAVRHGSDRSESPTTVMTWGYPLALLTLQVMLLFAAMLFIVPKYIWIFEDYDARLPPVTIWVIEFSKWLGGPLLGLFGAEQYNEYQLVPGLFWLLVLVGLVWGVVGLRHTAALKPLIDPLVWYTPGLGLWTKRRSMGDACHVVEQALAAGLPLDTALEEASRCRVNAVLRRRLVRWGDGVRNGRPVADAGRAAGMPATLVAMLGSAQASGHLVDAFAFLRRHYDITFSRLAVLVQGAALPIAVMICAVLTGIFAFSLFQPIVEVIWQVTPVGAGGKLL